MKFSKIAFSLLTLLLAQHAASQPRPGQGGTSQIRWSRSLSQAQAQAGRESKLIIADLIADWCGWCKKMEVETWAHPDVIAEGPKYVFLKLNAEKEADGIALRKKFGVTGFPTVLILDSRGNEFERLEGYLPASQFLSKLNAAITDPDSLGNLRAEEIRSPKDLDVRFRLGRKLLGRYEFEQAEKRFREIEKRDPENRSQIADMALFYLALCQLSRSSTEDSLATIERLRENYPESKISPNATLLSGEILIQMGRLSDARERIRGFIRDYPDHPLTDRAKMLLSQL